MGSVAAECVVCLYACPVVTDRRVYFAKAVERNEMTLGREGHSIVSVVSSCRQRIHCASLRGWGSHRRSPCTTREDFGVAENVKM